MKIRRAVRVLLMLAGVPVNLSTTAVVYYRTLARLHGRKLVRGFWGGYYIA